MDIVIKYTDSNKYICGYTDDNTIVWTENKDIALGFKSLEEACKEVGKLYSNKVVLVKREKRNLLQRLFCIDLDDNSCYEY